MPNMREEIFVTSDSHYWHKNVIKYDRRPFYSVTNMNNELIFRWNEVVFPNDIVLHVGDFALTGANNKKAIIDQLNGKIVLIKGNHDNKSRTHWEERMGIAKFIKSGIFFPKSKVAIIHNPADIQNQDKYRLILHGHTHTRGGKSLEKIGKTLYINIGVDFRDFRPHPISEFVMHYYRKNIFIKELKETIASWMI